MATYRVHVTGAIITFIIYLSCLTALYAVGNAYTQFAPQELIVYVLALCGICVLFGLWPDVDVSSKAQKLFYTIFLIVDIALILSQYFEAAAYFGLLALLPVLSRHRGWTHTWWAALLVPSPFLVLPLLFLQERPLVGLPFFGAAVAGYASHLILDKLPMRRRS